MQRRKSNGRENDLYDIDCQHWFCFSASLQSSIDYSGSVCVLQNNMLNQQSLEMIEERDYVTVVMFYLHIC